MEGFLNRSCRWGAHGVSAMRVPGSVFSAVLAAFFCLGSPAFSLPPQHEVWIQENDAYRTMYERYDIGLQRIHDSLSEEAYRALEKKNEAALAESVRQAESAGGNAALACARTLAERILAMERAANKADSKRIAGDRDPNEGYYRLIGRQGVDGYLTISRDGNGGYCLEIAAWQTHAPQTFGWSQAQARSVGGRFSTSSVYQPDTAEDSDARDVQLHLAIRDGLATVTSTEAFRNGGYVWFSQGETTLVKNIVLDGTYRRMP